ncbi:hypothetical protein GCM10009804_41890 [Kribbella hippodromi]|uniref:Transmembrane protein n=1 Tax=Kribbella hippodromi TaxID=434347 RepID=A0ABN2DN08_9ACTN
MSFPAPEDPRIFHGYSDAPKHTELIMCGAWVAGLCGLLGFLAIATLGAPSDPCPPDTTGCGPEPLTIAKVGVGLLLVAALAAAWTFAWHLRATRYRFNPPPNWPPPAPTWQPPRGWTPPPTLPKAPTGWHFWH